MMVFKKATKGSRLKMEGASGDRLYGVGVGADESSGFLKGRWPRQETLALLEIRTRLHQEFQQAAAATLHNRSPLWDEVSRIMAEEFGYQRSGNKCKEKLGNLYKYYKKTKRGANEGSNNGRHYRFFRQLDALYGESMSIANDMHCLPSAIWEPQEEPNIQAAVNLSLISTSDELDNSTSSDGGIEESIKGLIERQMKGLMQAQESCHARMLGAIERIEEERVRREEAWKEQEMARREREERMWACERAWIQARDAVLMNALQKISCRCRFDSRQAPLPTADESMSMRSCSDQEDVNRREIMESQEPPALLMGDDDDDDEIADLIRIQSWVQPEIDGRYP